MVRIVVNKKKSRTRQVVLEILIKEWMSFLDKNNIKNDLEPILAHIRKDVSEDSVIT
jgi:hypothetical protein